MSGIAARSGQLNPALASRFNVNRIVDGATPTRWVISSSRPMWSSNKALHALGAPLSSLLTCAPRCKKLKGRAPIGPAEAWASRRHHPGIILEHRARSNSNTARYHPGFASDFRRKPCPVAQFAEAPRSSKPVLIGPRAIPVQSGTQGFNREVRYALLSQMPSSS